VYVLTAIKIMLGETYNGLETRVCVIDKDHSKKGDRAHLLKAQISNGLVTIHKGQSSAMLSSYVDANCLLFLDSQANEVQQGDKVEVLMLP
jgi:molybdopterin molybdotransferase